jgi:hypothetical protein
MMRLCGTEVEMTGLIFFGYLAALHHIHASHLYGARWVVIIRSLLTNSWEDGQSYRWSHIEGETTLKVMDARHLPKPEKMALRTTEWAVQ